MFDVFMDALIDSAKMIPLLLLIYTGIEFTEYKFGGRIREKIKNAGKAGPALGAVFGCVPQCGFSVISSALYTERLITVGTLLAVYLSTSDEAIPIILAQPDKAGIVLPLILTKVVIAVIAGYAIDLIMNKCYKSLAGGEICATCDGEMVIDAQNENPTQGHEDDHAGEERGCCGHSFNPVRPAFKELVLHPVVHTFKVFFFIFGVSLLINLIIFRIGEENLGSVFLANSVWQPVLAAFVGLIPNCAASVAITEVFLKGGISFGAAIAGLCSSAGLGVIVLLKENNDPKDTLRVVGMLLGISIIAGIIVQYLYG